MIVQKKSIKNYDIYLVVLVVLLNIIGILVIGSAKESVQMRQVAGMIGGMILMLLFSFIDYSILLKCYLIIYIVNLGLLLLVKTGLGTSSGGAQRWLNIAGIPFQPSETAKIALILFLAQFISLNDKNINKWKWIGVTLILACIPIFLVYKQPDMSTSILLVIILCVMLFVGGISYRIIAASLGIIVPLGLLFIALILQPVEKNVLLKYNIVEPYHRLRVLAWLHPDEYSDTLAYQQYNSIMAIGSGQLHGKGYKSDSAESISNSGFIPEPQTDFIFAVIGEEFGFIGCSIVVLLYLLISFECLKIAYHARDGGGKLIVSGVGAWIFFQAFINISVATGLIPNTGITLPFVSYGLTSLLSLYIGIGITLNVRLQSRVTNRISSHI